jgi:hypothetical protein
MFESACDGVRPPPRSAQYHARLCEYLDTYEKAFIVGADNVGSKQFSDIRAVRAWAWTGWPVAARCCRSGRARQERKGSQQAPLASRCSSGGTVQGNMRGGGGSSSGASAQAAAALSPCGASTRGRACEGARKPHQRGP